MNDPWHTPPPLLFFRLVFCSLFALHRSPFTVHRSPFSVPRRYVLVSLICHGTLKDLPKYTPNPVSRHIKDTAKEYVDLSTAFAKGFGPHNTGGVPAVVHAAGRENALAVYVSISVIGGS